MRKYLRDTYKESLKDPRLGSIDDYLTQMSKAKNTQEVEKIVRSAKGNPNADKAYRIWRSKNSYKESYSKRYGTSLLEEKTELYHSEYNPYEGPGDDYSDDPIEYLAYYYDLDDTHYENDGVDTYFIDTYSIEIDDMYDIIELFEEGGFKPYLSKNKSYIEVKIKDGEDRPSKRRVEEDF